jgi:hypothetical protein
MDALTRAVVHAKDFYQNDSLGWSNVIEATLEIVTPEDIEAFRKLCIEEEYNLKYDSFDETHVEEFYKVAIQGDVESENGSDDWGEYNGELRDRGDPNAHEGFLAVHMWKCYVDDWLSRRPEELERFKQFEVSPQLKYL